MLLSPIAYIGPGGPEIVVVMLVLLLLFGAKDAPRILRKLSDFQERIRTMADGLKQEVMYGDLYTDDTDLDADEVEYPAEVEPTDELDPDEPEEEKTGPDVY